MSRKPRQKMYFGEEQEKAVVDYLQTDCEIEKNKIFNEYLRSPLTIMVESIIRRYKLYRKDLQFDEIFNDTLSFLFTKIDKFDPTKNYKAYSYFGTICKNYLMGVIQKEMKEQNRTTSYNDISSDIEESEDLSYTIDDEGIDYAVVINKLREDMEVFVTTENLTVNETKLGYALIDLFKEFNLHDQIGDGNKFNKNLILLSLREMTLLTTKEIRQSMKKYKLLYSDIITGFLEN